MKINEEILLFIIAMIFLIVTFVFILLLFKVHHDYDEFHAYVINLARRRDRMIQFGNHYNLPVKYEIIDAVDGRTLNARALKEQGVIGDDGLKSIMTISHGGPKRFHYELGTIGAVGCSLSHIKIWEKIVQNKTKYNMIFEDDAWVIGVDMTSIINRLNSLPDDWHIYMIGQPHSILEGIPIIDKPNLYKLTRFCGTHAYIINYEGAKWLLEKGKLFPIQQQIDAHLSELGWDHGLNVYLHLNAPMIGPFSEFSDIQVNSSQATWERYRI